jgi:ABC-2 type transport system ATP-binding protein
LTIRADPGPAIEVDAVVKWYGKRAVVDGISFEVSATEICALVGPNGAGKTTTVEIIEGYRRADRGAVRVLGTDPRRSAAALRARMGLMLQQGGIDPRMRPLETLRLHAAFFDRPRDPDELVDMLGLRTVAATPYRRLSGGERQRLGLALALVGSPEVLVLDEPTAGMDPEAKAATRELLASLRGAGVAILITTHELADVERLADRIVVMASGRARAVGTPAEIVAGSTPRLRFRLAGGLDERDRRRLEELLGGTLAGKPGGLLRLDGIAPAPALVASLAAWCAERAIRIVELQTGSTTLEERYLELLAEART